MSPEGRGDAPQSEVGTRRRGPIAWMAQNSVAANLAMVFLVAGGIGMAFFMKKEVMPDSTLDVVEVSVSYPGASPSEVESGILLPVEEAVRGLAVVKELTATARENSGTVTVELTAETERSQGLQRINQAVDSIQTFPADAEDPEVRLQADRREVLELHVWGEAGDWSIRQVAERVRNRLVRERGVTQVELERTRDYITHVEIPEHTLRAHDLTLGDVADRIRNSSEDVPGGRVETDQGKLMLRVKERKQWARAFARIPILTTEQGTVVRLSDLGSVRDGFAETTHYSEFSGKPLQELAVYRIGDQTPMQVSRTVRETMAEMAPQLPGDIDYRIANDRTRDYRLRRDLLLKNGLIGLGLVLAVMALFLQFRLAMWVAVGMFISFVGSFLFLPALGVSLNMVSMFAFLIALGIVVDDAIVVGENVYAYRESGMGLMDAAIEGARDMAMPVTFAILTNCIAFAPLLFIPGEMGLIWATIPLVVITVFLISLFEALFILPAHLGHAGPAARNRLARGLHDRQQAFSVWFRERVQWGFRPILDVCVRHRYVSIAVAVSTFTAVAGYAASDRMGKILMPSVPSREFAASAHMPAEVTDAKARAVTKQLTDAVVAVVEENGGKALAEGVKSNIYGTTVSVDVVMARGERPISLEKFERLWRERAGPVPSAERLTFEMEGGFGFWRPDITVDLSHPRPASLRRAAETLTSRLAEYEVTSDVNDSYSPGGPRLDYQLNERGRALGLTPEMVGRQVRNAFQGADARRFLRGPNEVRVRVKLPDREQRSDHDVASLMLRPPGGGEVSLAEVADVERGTTFQSIERRQARRVVTVESDVNPKSAITRMLTTMRQELLPALAADFPGLTWSFQGRQAQMRESLSALFAGLILAVLAIYAMLAIPFGSYVQPLIVMVALPFGAFGAIVGHLLLGYNLSILSLMGIVGLSGIVVNDSLIMVDYANRQRRAGSSAAEAIKLAGVRRFRPIMLTTLTTFGGLTPIILETSRQAQFLIPMAVSLGFGILFATGLLLIVVPCFYMVVEDGKALFGSD